MSLVPLNSQVRQQRHDGWQGDTGESPPNVSTTHIIVGLVLVLALLGAVAGILHESPLIEADAQFLSPREGASYDPGSIAVRLRVTESSQWALYIKRPGAIEWEELRHGTGSADPGVADHGLYFIQATEIGQYQLRLVAQFNNRTEEDKVQFLID